MDITIVTGLSGSGKSLTANLLEDMGFFCIDNMPPQLVAELTRVLSEGQSTIGHSSNEIRLALVMDTRIPKFVQHLQPALKYLKDSHVPVRILFLETSDAVFQPVQPIKARPPSIATLAGEGERKRSRAGQALATDIIDTTELSKHSLRETAAAIGHMEARDEMTVLVQSFGFKYGLPPDADIVCDVRFLPNPHYIERLRPLSGLDQPVIDFINQYPEAEEYIKRQCDLLAFTIPFYIREGKQRLSICVGCTGGRHRSVMTAERKLFSENLD